MGPHPGVILRLAAGGQDAQQESRCGAKYRLRLLRERAKKSGTGPIMVSQVRLVLFKVRLHRGE